MIHELGHFITAKKLGILVEEFGFGLPPRIWGKKIGETTYSINWLPIGGFVKLYGEDAEEPRTKDQELSTKDKKSSEFSVLSSQLEKRAFYSRPVWQRIVVLVAGVAMNFILGIVIISYLFTQGVMVPTDRVHIEKIVSGSPAEVAGLKEKDVILKLRTKNQELKTIDTEIKKSEDLIDTTKEHLGQQIILVVEREGKELELTLTPRKDYPADEGPMGVTISTYEEKKYSLAQAPILGTKEALILSWELVKGIGTTIWKLISFQPVSKDVAGPIGIAQITGEAVKFGQNAVLELLGLLSLNLAIVNILPFPALDGGRLLFVLIEGATGRRLKATWERYVHQIGMAILLALILLVTINDLIRIIGK